MKRNCTSTAEHYDLLIDEIDDPAQPTVADPFWDSGVLRAWMAQTDGPAFWQAVGEVHGKTVLEVGIGTGRVAKKMLDRGCAHLVGIDVSGKSIARARQNLAAYRNVELVHADIAEYRPKAMFDLAFLVWTIFHIEDKPRALDNIVAALKPGGRLVISLECVDEWLDYGPRKVRQYPVSPDSLIAMLEEHECLEVAPPVAVYDAMAPALPLLATVIAAHNRDVMPALHEG